MKAQRRGRRIALTEEERDAFLSSARTCRVATVNARGPHVSPLWFLWHGGSIWLYSITSSQRFTDLQRDPRIAIVVDDGVEYNELRGVEITGRARIVGEVPRVGPNLFQSRPPMRGSIRSGRRCVTTVDTRGSRSTYRRL